MTTKFLPCSVVWFMHDGKPIFGTVVKSDKNEDGSYNLAWSLGCLAVAVICDFILGKEQVGTQLSMF